MGKESGVKAKVELADGRKLKVSGRGVMLLLEKDIKCAGVMLAGTFNPAHIAEAMVRHAGRHDDVSCDIMRELVANILLLGSQDRDLLDEARFSAETMALLQSVLDEGGDEDE